jgi:site-specific recombinase
MLLAKLPAGCSMPFILLCLWYLHKGYAKQQPAMTAADHVYTTDTRHCLQAPHAAMQS